MDTAFPCSLRARDAVTLRDSVTAWQRPSRQPAIRRWPALGLCHCLQPGMAEREISNETMSRHDVIGGIWRTNFQYPRQVVTASRKTKHCLVIAKSPLCKTKAVLDTKVNLKGWFKSWLLLMWGVGQWNVSLRGCFLLCVWQHKPDILEYFISATSFT